MFTFKTNEEYEAEQAALLEESAESIDAEESEVMDEDPAYRLISCALDLIDEGSTAAAAVLCNRALDILTEEVSEQKCISEKDAKFLIADEQEAIKGYERVITRSPKEAKKMLEHIRDDEKHHIKEIEELRNRSISAKENK